MSKSGAPKTSKKRFKIRNVPGFPELSVGDEIVMQNVQKQIKDIYEKYGYGPLDTRLVEPADILFMKGIDGKEVYALGRIHDGSLDMGDDAKQILALRFDLTVPLARYIVQHKKTIHFPFKRYHIAKVYRGEAAKESAGRYREFYQSDIDVVGSEGRLSHLYDSEFPAIIYDIFKNVMNIDRFVMRINNRKILEGLFIEFGVTDVTLLKKAVKIIDNMEKVPLESTYEALGTLGIEFQNAKNVLAFFNICRYNNPLIVVSALKKCTFENDILMEGIDEIYQVIYGVFANGVPMKYIQFDPSIARGLDYYTGTVYETNLLDYPEFGSVCSGGRYDKLTTSISGNERDNFPGCGISIGLSRLVPALIQNGILSAETNTVADVIILRQDDTLISEYQSLGKILREAGISCDIMYNDLRFKSQMNFADKKGFKVAIFANKDEMSRHEVTVKYLRVVDESGKSVQDTVNIDIVVETINEYLSTTVSATESVETESEAFDISEQEANIAKVYARICTIFTPSTPVDLSIVENTMIKLSEFRPVSDEAYVLWYVGARGLRTGAIDTYKDMIASIQSTGGYVFLLDLLAWSSFSTKGGTVTKYYKKIKTNTHLNVLHTSDFFMSVLGYMSNERLAPVMKEIFADATFYEVSKDYTDSGLTLQDVFGEKHAELLSGFIDPSTDTAKCYSVFQFVEMLYIIEKVSAYVVSSELKINFVLPNDELKYYDVMKLMKSLSEFLTIMDVKIRIDFTPFEYGSKMSDRPYNDGETV